MLFSVVSSKNINRQKYAECIASDNHATTFVEPWYLDITADEWMVLTDETYSTVFPFSVRKKFGVDYIYQPFFNRCTGIYGENKKEIIHSITEGSLNRFRFWDFYADDLLSEKSAGYTQRVYQALPLNNDYNRLYENYSTKLRRSLRHAKKDGIVVKEGTDVSNFADQFRKHTGDKIAEFKEKDYNVLNNVAEACMQHKNSIYVEVHKDSQVTAAALFTVSSNRVLYIEGFSTPQGRELRSMHVIFNEIIERFASSGKTLDFGGSNVPPIAHFFRSFGAIDHTYHHVYRNRLPLIVRWMKKGNR
jgi:hypothetical protein